jgi:poly(3-hydroxybutyrate) depolymerase
MNVRNGMSRATDSAHTEYAHTEAQRTNPRGYYYVGATTIFASRFDQRFSFCLYVPQQHNPEGRPLPLVVLQHGTGRRGPQYRDQFADFAEQYGCIILAPLFPAGIDDSEDLHNFKFIRYGDIRFDQVLLEIVDEVGERFNVETERFLLHGFSGGGQFAHRFFYLHPERLAAISIGAPGRITRLDPTKDWWLGLRGFDEIFGQQPDIAEMRQVPVHMVVGAADVETWEINNPGDTNWMNGAEEAGNTRIERLRTLEQDFVDHGIQVRFDMVEGVAHNPMEVLQPVKDFFAAILADRTTGAQG